MNSSSILASVNASTSTPLVVQSMTKVELWIQLTIFYGLMCGVIANLLNALIFAGIMRRKEMRTRFFVVVASLSLCRTGICSQILVLSIYRSLRTAGIVSVLQPRLLCHFFHFWLINGYTLELTLLASLLLERILAITTPKYYYKFSKKSINVICLSQYIVVSLAKLVPSYFEDMLQNVECINLYSFLSHEFNSYTQTIDLSLTGLILVLYCFLILYVRWKSHKIRKSKVNTEQTTGDAGKCLLERHLKLMPVLRTLILFHCMLTLAGKLFAFLSGVIVAPEYSQRLVACSGVFVCLDQFINAVTLITTNKEVRAAALPWLRRGQQVGQQPTLFGHTRTQQVMKIEIR